MTEGDLIKLNPALGKQYFIDRQTIKGNYRRYYKELYNTLILLVTKYNQQQYFEYYIFNFTNLL